jgi:hypothetical protein
MTSVRIVADGSMDVIAAMHNIEHVYPRDVPTTMKFRCVLT